MKHRNEVRTLALIGLFLLIDTFLSVPSSSQVENAQQESYRQRQLLLSSHRGFGTHYVTLLVGSPAQPLRLAVSIGSEYTAFPCTGCDDSCHEPLFQPKSIHEFPTECVYPESIGQDGSEGCHVSVKFDADDDLGQVGYKGVEASDKVFLLTNQFEEYSDDTAAKSGHRMDFICQQEAVGRSILGDGYLGMSTSSKSFVNQLHDAKVIHRRMFSLCFRDFDEYQPEGSSAGHVSFGAVDREKLDSPLLWAANTASSSSPSTYTVHIRRVYLGIGGNDDYDTLTSVATQKMSLVPLDSKDAFLEVVDYKTSKSKLADVPIMTNKPTTVLDAVLEEPFQKAFFSITGFQYAPPYFDLSEEQFSQLPTVFLQIESQRTSQGHLINADLIPGFVGRNDPKHPYDILLSIPPAHYVVYYDGRAFPTLLFGSESHRISSNVLQNHEVVFDLDHGRIGFAERRNCPEGASFLTSSSTEINDGIYQPRSSDFNANGNDMGTAEESREIRSMERLVANETIIEPPLIAPRVAAGGSPGKSERTVHDAQTTETDHPIEGLDRDGTISAPVFSQQDLDRARVPIASHQADTAGNGNGVTGELDEHGASTSDGTSSFKIDEDAQYMNGVSIPAEYEDGLPGASGEASFRIGPQAIMDVEHLHTVEFEQDDSLYWNIMGFACVLIGFFVTVYFTQDGFGEATVSYTYGQPSKYDASQAKSFWVWVMNRRPPAKRKDYGSKSQDIVHPAPDGGQYTMSPFGDPYTYSHAAQLQAKGLQYYENSDHGGQSSGVQSTIYSDQPYYDAAAYYSAESPYYDMSESPYYTTDRTGRFLMYDETEGPYYDASMPHYRMVDETERPYYEASKHYRMTGETERPYYDASKSYRMADETERPYYEKSMSVSFKMYDETERTERTESSGTSQGWRDSVLSSQPSRESKGGSDHTTPSRSISLGHATDPREEDKSSRLSSQRSNPSHAQREDSQRSSQRSILKEASETYSSFARPGLAGHGSNQPSARSERSLQSSGGASGTIATRSLYEDFGESGTGFCHESIASGITYDEESVFVPKKADRKKFIKPVRMEGTPVRRSQGTGDVSASVIDGSIATGMTTERFGDSVVTGQDPSIVTEEPFMEYLETLQGSIATGMTTERFGGSTVTGQDPSIITEEPDLQTLDDDYSDVETFYDG